MPLETSRYDSAHYLDSEEAIAAFLEAADEEQFDTDAERVIFLAHINATVERARARLQSDRRAD